LVGHRTWRLHLGTKEITVNDAHEGVAQALRRLGSLVYEPALADASDVDKTFLLAMAKDDGPSKMADIQQRLGVNESYASQYRLRLIAAELIEPKKHGYVDFALPYLREYLRDEAAAEI
jgi:predicted MarR family transcription regulator